MTAAQDPVTQWRVSGADDSFRAVLGKWTARANASADAPTPRWRLIWDYPGEVPVDGEGGFDGDYKSAVKWLIASTSMLDTPLQPCFYSNNVVRVIRQTEKCDPSE
ncbi:TcpQ domain-containing protein [Burkholderia cepacia]|uniref:TcpQ domain-containing protein n=1 Tax=Burkholderia cepacia TaxID=292 RepID=UPI00141A04B1|nr:TcpQ domain-containing protein [Burkholderia cepacia]